MEIAQGMSQNICNYRNGKGRKRESQKAPETLRARSEDKESGVTNEHIAGTINRRHFAL